MTKKIKNKIKKCKLELVLEIAVCTMWEEFLEEQLFSQLERHYKKRKIASDLLRIRIFKGLLFLKTFGEYIQVFITKMIK
jgi:hypothetical protein